MSASEQVLELVRSAATKKLLFLPHAVSQMSRPERLITTKKVREVISKGDLIEDYPNDPRGHSCLILGWSEGHRPIHVVCSPKKEFLAIITAYNPSEKEWESSFKMRKN